MKVLYFVIFLLFPTCLSHAQNVYVCSNTGTSTYHVNKECRSLASCSGMTLIMSEKQALNDGYSMCNNCGKRSDSVNSNPQNRPTNNTVAANPVPSVSTATSASHIELAKVKSGVREEIVRHIGYTASYNDALLISNWVAWELTNDEVNGTGKRPGRSFEPDPTIHGRSATHQDYTKSGYSRGHMAPAADMKWSEQAMKESFYLTNVCPQKAELNTSMWNRLEEKTRALAKKGGSIYVCCGPIVEKGYKTIGSNNVAVPSYFYKVLCRVVNGRWSAIGFIFPNQECKGGMFDYAMPVDDVESITGIDFFYNLPDGIEREIESSWKQKDWQ